MSMHELNTEIQREFLPIALDSKGEKMCFRDSFKKNASNLSKLLINK